MPNAKHKPDCDFHTFDRHGSRPCTCGADKPTQPAPTEAEVLEALEYLTDFRHSLLTTVGPEFTARIDILLAALEQAQEVKQDPCWGCVNREANGDYSVECYECRRFYGDHYEPQAALKEASK